MMDNSWPLPHPLFDLATQRSFNEYKYARTTPLNIKTEPYFEQFKALGAAVLADFGRYGYALVQLPPEQDDLVRQETARIDAMRLHMRPEKAAHGKVAVTVPALACEPAFARVLTSPKARVKLLSAPEVQAAAAENVARIEASTVRLADALHVSAVFITGALCSAHTGERFHDEEVQLLRPSPYHSALGGSSMMCINVYGSSAPAAPVLSWKPTHGSTSTPSSSLGTQTSTVPHTVATMQPHIDLGLMTLVVSHIADEGGKLEIRRGGPWVTLPKDLLIILPGKALIKYLGDSGSALEAAEHRACAPTMADGRRISVAFHLRPNPAAPSVRRSERREAEDPHEVVPEFSCVLQGWHATTSSVNVSSSGGVDLILGVAHHIAAQMSYNIWIYSIMGRKTFVQVDLDATVHELKHACEKASGTPVGQQILMFNGIQMDDEDLLSKYNIPQTRQADAPVVGMRLLLCGD